MKILLKKNYLYAIRKSTNTRMFQSFFVEDNGKEIDLLQGGENSCAYYVTSILKHFNLLEEIHTTVDDTYHSLLQNQWEECSAEQVEPGDIVIWDKDGVHAHIGFAVSEHEAVSTNKTTGRPRKHDLSFLDKKPVSHVLRFPF